VGQMSDEIIIAIISGVITILVGILTAYVAYRGSVQGARIQIEHEKANLQEEINEQRIFANSVIERFVIHELKKNFKVINSDYMRSYIPVNPTPFQHGFRDSDFIFKEFDRVKFDLIKYESELVKEIIEIYDVFYLLARKEDIMHFSQNEYDNFKRIFDICLTKYND
jgi:hypothetical protein